MHVRAVHDRLSHRDDAVQYFLRPCFALEIPRKRLDTDDDVSSVDGLSSSSLSLPKLQECAAMMRL